jgi:hypothetical protein
MTGSPGVRPDVEPRGDGPIGDISQAAVNATPASAFEIPRFVAMPRIRSFSSKMAFLQQ